MANAKWVLDPTHSELGFKVRHLMISNVKGSFTKFDASIDGEDFSSSTVHVSIETNSISTNNADRDAHLKGADFFDAEQFGKITFHGNKYSKNDDGEYSLTGTLTVKGVSKEITLDVEFGGANKDPWGNEKMAFVVSGKINRTDFGLTWNAALETGGVLVSDEVKINAEVQFVKIPA